MHKYEKNLEKLISFHLNPSFSLQLFSVEDRRESSWWGFERRMPRSDSRQVGRKARTAVNPPQWNVTLGIYWHRSVSPKMECAVQTDAIKSFFFTLVFQHKLIPLCVVLHRATCKVCGTDKWAQALPLAAWELLTTPWSTWTMTADPLHPSQPQHRSSGSE